MSTVEAPGGEAPARSLSRHLLVTGLTNVGILGVNFATGVLVARLLGPAGRGETAVLATLAQIVGWLAAMGLNEGMTYLAAKRPHDVPRIVGTSLSMVAVLGTVGVLLAQLVLPFVLSAQDPALVEVGRWFLFSVYLGVASGLLMAVLSGNHDFDGMNVVRFIQPATYLVGLVTLVVVDRVTVATVLGAAVLSTGLAALAAFGRVIRSTGIARPSAAIAREAAAYGLKVQGSLLGGLGTARLDFLLLPTILSAASIGLYSVAVNTSAVLVSVIGAAGQIVMPAAARRGGREGALLVARMLRLIVYGGTAAALPLFVAAPQLLTLVYGEEFAGAAAPLRILLPGVIFAMASGVLEGGLQAVNRPLAGSVGQLIGFAVTIVGLLLTLRPFGIIGAAGTTTVAYLIAYAVSLWFLVQDEHFSWRESLSLRGLGADVAGVLARFRRGVAPGGSAAG